MKHVKVSDKPRCKACVSCVMGVMGCDGSDNPHGHGCTQICGICGIAYYHVHPHSNLCPSGTPVEDNVKHDEDNLRRQLQRVNFPK